MRKLLSLTSLLSLLAVTACGGGGSDSANSGGLTSPVSSNATTTSTSPGGSTTSSSTSTSVGGTTSSSATTSSTSTSSTAGTTSSTTSTTARSGNLPPLSSTPIVLDKASGAQLGTSFWGEGDTASGGHGATIGNANCVSYDNINTLQYYVHFHLSIFKDGQRLAIPRYIGYASSCLYEINSDNLNGVVDLFSTTQTFKKFTLGDMFGVWGQPLSWTNIAGITGEPVVIYIEDGGKLSQYTGDPAALDLVWHRSVTIQIGTPLSEIPTYSWVNYDGNGE